MNEWLKTGWSALLQAPAILVQPAGRVFWPFVLTSLVIAAVVYVRRRRRGAGPDESLLSFLLPRAIWRHPSSLVDIKLIFAKAVIQALLLAPLVVSAYAVATFVIELLSSQFGVIEPLGLSRLQVSALYTLVLFVAWDLSRYLLHRLLHAVPLLWSFHQVHHSAEVLTPLTIYRTHPLESLLYALRGGIVTGLVTGGFFLLFRDKAVQMDMLGVNLIGMLFNIFGANLRHSHIWLSYGPKLERLFISPAQHQLHHSLDAEHHGSNYGSFLAIWDGMAGELRLAGEERELRFGLAAAELNHDPRSATSCVVGPILSLGARLPMPHPIRKQCDKLILPSRVS